MGNFKTRLVGAALLCLGCSAGAQMSGNGALEPLVVTATRTPVPLSQVLADVTVISRDDLERQASGTMVDLLSRVPGFQVARNGGPGADGNVYLRGGETRHIAVLIDGVRIDTQNASGGASWQMLSLSQIDRVEIVRGPVSALYGSDAISGVVQIFTKKGKGPVALDLGVAVGELGFLKADAGLSGSTGLFDYAVSASRERSDGFSARNNAKPGTQMADRDGYLTEGASLRLGFTPLAAHRIEAIASQRHLLSRYDSTVVTRDDYGVRDLHDLKLQWSAQWLDSWSSQVAVGQSADRYATPLVSYLTQTHVETASWLNAFKWGGHSATALLERREDTLKNSDVVLSGTSGQGQRSDDGLGLGYAWRAHGTAIQLNARTDWDSEFGAHSTGTVAAGQDFADHWNVHASWGTGYRAPTLYQRFSKYGNLTLKPESSRNAEVGVRYQKDGAQWGLTAYNNWVTDLITGPPGSSRTCVQDSAYCYRNTALAHLQGVSVNGVVPLGPVRLSGAIDFDSSKNALNDADLQRRARRHASLRLDTDLKQWTLGAQLLAVGKRFDDAANTKPLGGYTVVNLDALYRFNARWRLLARIDNVADKKYENAQTYSSTPRTAIIGVRWTPEL